MGKVPEAETSHLAHHPSAYFSLGGWQRERRLQSALSTCAVTLLQPETSRSPDPQLERVSGGWRRRSVRTTRQPGRSGPQAPKDEKERGEQGP